MLGGEKYLGEDSVVNRDLKGADEAEAESEELADMAEADLGEEHEDLEEGDLPEAEPEELEADYHICINGLSGFSEGHAEGYYAEEGHEPKGLEGHEDEGLEEHNEHLGEGAYHAYEAEGVAEALAEGEAKAAEIKEEQDSMEFTEGGPEPPELEVESCKSKTDQPMESCPLSTLASATLASVKSEATADSKSTIAVKNEAEKWHRVGVFSNPSANVTGYLNMSDIMMDLEPGQAYKFRVAAVNSLGQSEWSEIVAFKTALEGFPGGPSAIKISRSMIGAHLSWQPPVATPGNTDDIIEYSVYLALGEALPTNTDAGDIGEKTPPVIQLRFMRVYCGAPPQCVVTHATLTSAHINYTGKPAIIFHIAACNQKGYGCATQVRWLQENMAAPSPVARKSSTPKKEPAKKGPPKKGSPKNPRCSTARGSRIRLQ